MSTRNRFDVAIIHPHIRNGLGDAVEPERFWTGLPLPLAVLRFWAARLTRRAWPAYRGSRWTILPSEVTR